MNFLLNILSALLYCTFIAHCFCLQSYYLEMRARRNANKSKYWKVRVFIHTLFHFSECISHLTLVSLSTFRYQTDIVAFSLLKDNFWDHKSVQGTWKWGLDDLVLTEFSAHEYWERTKAAGFTGCFCNPSSNKSNNINSGLVLFPLEVLL